MARKTYFGKLISRNDITEELKLIDGSVTDYITPSGQIYKDYGNGFFPKKNTLNKANGYLYCGITMADGKNKQFRTHILVAKAFVPNPDNLPYPHSRRPGGSGTAPAAFRGRRRFGPSC